MILNTQYFSNLRNTLDSCKSCAELGEVASALREANAQLELLIADAGAQLEIFNILTHVPTNLGTALSWIQNLITALVDPQLRALATSLAQLTELTAEIAQLQATIAEVASRFPDCSV